MEKEKTNSINLQLFADPSANGGDPAPEGNKELQSTIDKAVTKALQTQKANLDAAHQAELQALQNKLNAFEEKGLTDAEKVERQLKAAVEAEKQYKVKEQKLELGISFSKMGISEDDYSPIIDAYLSGQFILANQKIGEIIDKRANELAAQKYNDALSKTPDPNIGKDPKNGEMTREKFVKMSYTEQMELLEKHPEYAKFL